MSIVVYLLHECMNNMQNVEIKSDRGAQTNPFPDPRSPCTRLVLSN